MLATLLNNAALAFNMAAFIAPAQGGRSPCTPFR
jgi:hypothetical protein